MAKELTFESLRFQIWVNEMVNNVCSMAWLFWKFFFISLHFCGIFKIHNIYLSSYIQSSKIFQFICKMGIKENLVKFWKKNQNNYWWKVLYKVLIITSLPIYFHNNIV